MIKLERNEEILIQSTPLFGKLINWMMTRLGKVTYSMNDRLGPNSYDCSSAVYFALAEGGFLPYGAMGNTDSLFRDLENNGWEQLDSNNTQYKEGDIFIWGIRGNSSGSVGHCGIFQNEIEIIHCNYTQNGISINDYLSYWKEKGSPPMTVYRFIGDNPPFLDQTYTLTFVSGVFIPNTKLPVCAEPTEISPALAYYEAGMQINYDSYTIYDRYVWISYIANSGNRRYVAVGPDDNKPETVWGSGFEKPIKKDNYELTYLSGVFIPNTKLPVCAEPTETSPALAYYEAGMQINYDSYTIYDHYVWISYIANSGNRRYIAVGPDDNNKETVWGSGFEKPIKKDNYELTYLSGVFIPNTKLPVCAEPTEISPALDYYEAGMQINYDSYTIYDRYVWISYIASSGNRRYVAVGPDDNNPGTVWGSGFEKPTGNTEGKDTPYTVSSPRYVNGIMIVNKKNPVPYNYAPYENAEAGDQVRTLIKDMQDSGYNISNSYSGFRSFETQARLYQNYVNSYGKEEADTFSARAGYSEHQTGLAFDLLHSDGSLVENNDEVNWIAENAHKYGFIVRYIAGKEHITGYQAEPWHIRYIGNIATKIYNSGLTLEEYLGVEGGSY